MSLGVILQIATIASAVLMMIAILLQQRGTGLGASFGSTGNVYRTKRGIEHILQWVTIVTAVLFAFSSFLAVIY
jgi:protein translocase SecG subunit